VKILRRLHDGLVPRRALLSPPPGRQRATRLFPGPGALVLDWQGAYDVLERVALCKGLDDGMGGWL